MANGTNRWLDRNREFMQSPLQIERLTRRRYVRGWSLLEILITLVIVALLTVLGLPSYQAARHVADEMQCSTRLRNLAMAGTTWIIDHDGAMLDAMYWRFPNATHSGSLLPYLGYNDAQLGSTKATALSCPASFREVGPNPDWNRCYSINISACMSESGARIVPYDRNVVRIQQVARPSAMAFFMDGNFLATGSPERKVGSASLIPWNAKQKTGFYARHRGNRANVVFLDGHVQAMTVEEFPQGTPTEQRLDPFWGSIQ